MPGIPSSRRHSRAVSCTSAGISRKSQLAGKHADVLVIGAGPAGLSAGMYLARAGRRTVIIDRDGPGGQAQRLGRIENFPGFPAGISGRRLMERFVAQALRWKARLLRMEVRTVAKDIDGFRVRTASGDLKCRALLLCTGSAFKPLGIMGHDRLQGIHHAAFDEAWRYQGKDVVVAGGGEAAVHQAMELARHAKRVTLVCRGKGLKAIGLLREALAKMPNVRCLFGAEVAGVCGRDRLHAVLVRGLDQEHRIRAHALFVLIGKVPDRQLISWKRSPPGFFSAGDVCQGDFRQVAIAAGDGIRAAMSCERFLRACQ